MNKKVIWFNPLPALQILQPLNKCITSGVKETGCKVFIMNKTYFYHFIQKLIIVEKKGLL